MKIKELRKKHSLSQSELAIIAKTTQRCISSYENETAEPDITTLKIIADYFHITIDELVGHEVPYLIDKSLLSDEEISIINEIKDLDTIQRIKVLAYIDGLKEGKQKQETIIKKFEER